MNGKMDEKPKIELYMYSLNQEFRTGTGHKTYLKRYSEIQKDLTGGLVLKAGVESQVFRTPLLGADPSDWAAQWLENNWIENHTQAAGNGIRTHFNPLLSAIMREEDFGAILFEPQSDRVYKLNRAGMTLVRALREQMQAGVAEPESAAGFAQEDVTGFVAALKAAGLWGSSQ
jgi:hypothetical protein